jgi:hypothetical protein
LEAALPSGTSVELLRSLAEGVAAGTALAPEYNLGGAVVQEALTQGFGWVLLYGGISVWILAGISLLVFGHGLPRRAPHSQSCVEGDSRA